MRDELDPADGPSAAALGALGSLFARADVWDEPPAGLEDAVVAAISSEAANVPDVPDVPSPAVAGEPSTSLDRRRVGRRRGRATRWLAVAAAVAAVAVGIGLIVRDTDEPADDDLVVALAPTDAAGDATATARIAATPAGLRIVLDVDGLAGAPDGSFYEAWLSDGETRLSAGTFHLRNGDDPIALWAGIADPSFNRLSVTLEPLDGDTDSSGDVRFTGEFDLGG
jgi:hypothetical protein